MNDDLRRAKELMTRYAHLHQELSQVQAALEEALRELPGVVVEGGGYRAVWGPGPGRYDYVRMAEEIPPDPALVLSHTTTNVSWAKVYSAMGVDKKRMAPYYKPGQEKLSITKSRKKK